MADNFDPDAYLAAKTSAAPAGFDPDAYLAEKTGGAPVLATPKYKFSDDAIKSAINTKGSTVIYMRPDQYLALTPDLPDNPKTDRKGASLKKSLDKGDEVDEVPSLNVNVAKDGTAKVVDQDGRHRALFAQQNGLDQIPVRIQHGGQQALITKLAGMKDGSEPIPYDFKPVLPPVTASAKAAKGLPRWDPLGDTGRFAEASYEALKGDLKQAAAPIQSPSDIAKTGAGLLKAPIDALGIAASPIIGGGLHGIGGNVIADAVDKDPSKMAGTQFKDPKAFGDSMEDLSLYFAGDEGEEVAAAKGAAGPGGGGGNTLAKLQNAVSGATKTSAAKVGGDVVDETVGADYAAKVGRLKAEGIDPTIGQRKGGQVRRAEEAAKSDPLVGGAVRAQEQKAVDGFNRALYNRVLGPIGKKVSADIPVGRGALKTVGNKVSDEFETLKPKMRLKGDDDKFIGDLAEIRTQVGELPPAQQSQFEAILNNRLLHRMGQTGELDGETFKTVESELGTLARTYKSSADAAHRGLGDAISDVTDAMRSGLERSSDPGIRKQLANANKSYAILTRVEDAAAARKASGGVISPGDLLGSIKKMDKSARKRAFARGDALLQDFAQDSWDVLGNKMPDSGTPERLNFNHHGLLMYGVGKVTNPIASAAMNLAKRAETGAPAGPMSGNTLLHTTPLPGVQNQIAKGVHQMARVNGLRTMMNAAQAAAAQRNSLAAITAAQPPASSPQDQ